MSTKTTFKRLALVTVAALGLGLLSVAPSSAAVQLDNLTVSAASTTQVVGATAATTEVVVTASLASTNLETITVTATISAGPAFVAPILTFKESTTAATTGTGTSVILVSGRTSSTSDASAKYTLALNAPTVAGTYTVKLTTTGGTNNVSKTVDITVAAKTVGKASAFIGTAVSSPIAAETHTADATISVTGAANTVAKARIDVASIYGTTGNETVSVTDAPSVVVTTDKGLVSKTNQYVDGAKSVTTAAATANAPSYWVFSNGDIGKATITITVGTFAPITKTVTFTGVATTLAAKLTTGQATWVGIERTTTLDVSSTDVAGTAVNNPSGLTATSSDTSVATVVSPITATSAVLGTVTITGKKAGTAVITIADPATTGKATSVTYTVTVKANKPTTAPTITFDKTSYAVGEIITMTVNADMADSATAQLFTAALVTSATVTTVPGATGLPAGGQHAIVGGKVDYKFYAPAVSGSFTITGTGGSDIDLTTLVTAPTVTKTVDIVNPGVDAATAAAELAEAAAQDATDAALDATEAATLAGALAQEAVDAVADLSTQVATLIAALKKQITTLTNLVIKIQKKVRA
jgi:hypothetical protein